MKNSAVGLKICAVTSGIKKYKSIIKKKKKHDKTVLVEKTKSDAIEVLVSKALINSYISVNNVFRENNERRKNSEK